MTSKQLGQTGLQINVGKQGVIKKIQMNTGRLEEAQAVRSEYSTESHDLAHMWTMELAETLQISGRLLALEMPWSLSHSSTHL